jgi:hypothetical protein
MAIRVYPLRQRGRRLPRHAAAVAEGRVGSISLHTELRGTESYTAVTLRSGRPKEPELLPPLHEPVLVTLTDRGLLLRGYESLDGASYVQEWRCEFVSS